MSQPLKSRLAGILVVFAATALGCQMTDRYSTRDEGADLALQPSSRKIYVGETVTVFTRTENTLGKDAEIKWRTTGGQLTTEQAGRVARVKFEEPGTFSVDAMLMMEGREIRRESTTVEVASLP